MMVKFLRVLLFSYVKKIVVKRLGDKGGLSDRRGEDDCLKLIRHCAKLFQWSGCLRLEKRAKNTTPKLSQPRKTSVVFLVF